MTGQAYDRVVELPSDYDSTKTVRLRLTEKSDKVSVLGFRVVSVRENREGDQWAVLRNGHQYQMVDIFVVPKGCIEVYDERPEP